MLDGLGMAETTPGPLIMVTQFVGFLGAYRNAGDMNPMLAGTLGGLLTTWVTFVPCFLWIFLGAPFMEKMRGNRALAGALSAITAAVVGVILNLAVWFTSHTWFREHVRIDAGALSFDQPLLATMQPWAIALSLAAIVAIFRFNASLLVTLGACSAAGLALYLLGVVTLS
jgi:chromate transporter